LKIEVLVKFKLQKVSLL